jgi:secreted trypsin-like serine protease
MMMTIMTNLITKSISTDKKSSIFHHLQSYFNSQPAKMKILVFLAVFVFAFANAEEPSPFIVGGVNAFPGEFPFIVSIQHIFLGKRSSHNEY